MLLIDSILFSYAQIFFSNRRWFGALILLSSFLYPQVGLIGLLGVVLSNLLALYLKFDKQKVRSGFYGFNGILMGAAAGYFFTITPFMLILTIIFIVITFFISSSLEHLMANVFNLPGLSLPFIISLYIFLIFLTNYNSILYSDFHFAADGVLENMNTYLAGYFRAIGLIIFQTNILAGVIISLGLLFFSRVMFVNSIFAYGMNLIFLHLLFPQFNEKFFLLTSFNAILLSFALGGSLILLSRKTFVLLALSTVLVIVFTGFFSRLFTDHVLPILVLPFNFITLSTIYSLKFREEQTDFVLLYFKPGSPEENYYYHQNKKARFERFKFLAAELPFWGEWKVSQGIAGNITHKDDWRFAWDFVIENEEGKEFENDGVSVKDYYCFSTPVVSPLDGEVVNVFDNVPDNEIGDINLEANWGNSIVIDHGDGLFSQLSHLKRDTIKVKVGDKVKKGEVIAQCGNSGNSPTPHLHFQFQLTDRIGDKTYQFPFAYFIEKKEDHMELLTFDYPSEKKLVRNIETNKIIKKAFNFQLGDKLEFECKLDDKEFIERWEVKVDIYNQTYLENSNGDKVFFFKKDKLFILSDYIGKKYSALYYFYLLTIRVPFGYYEKLIWSDEIPISLTMNNAARFFSEFLLMFSQQIFSNIEHSFESREGTEDNFVVKAKLMNRGKKLFSFIHDEGEGELFIDYRGSIKEMNFNYGKKFSAKIIDGSNK